MFQVRSKDYLQKIVEEFFHKLGELNDSSNSKKINKQEILNDCFCFFIKNFDILQTDKRTDLITKIGDIDLLQQYAKLLLTKYELTDIKDEESLYTALDIVLYLESANNTYSWDRTILKEDILRRLSNL